MSYGYHRIDQRFIDKAKRIPENQRLTWLLKHKPVPVSYEDMDEGKRYLVRMPALVVFAAESLLNKVRLDVSLTSRIGNYVFHHLEPIRIITSMAVCVLYLSR